MSSQDLMQQMRSSAQDAGSWLENGAAAFESNVRNLLSTIDGAGILTHFSQDDNSHIDTALVRFQARRWRCSNWPELPGKNVSTGDEVVLFGRQGSAAIAPAELEAANSAILADHYTVWAQGIRVLVINEDM